MAAMNKNLEMLLALQELDLLRKSRALATDSAAVTEEALDARVARMRRAIPGDILAEYDRLAATCDDVVTVVVGRLCGGCRQPVPARLLHQIRQGTKASQCGTCGRFLVNPEKQPAYIAVS
jgi:predicted  nucleic acid-binding Zn-ribbon protein